MPELSEGRNALNQSLADRRTEPDSPDVQRLTATTKAALKRTMYMKSSEIMGTCLDMQNYKGLALYLFVLYSKNDISIDIDSLVKTLRDQLQASQTAGNHVASARVHLQNGDVFTIHSVRSEEYGYAKATFYSSRPEIDDALKRQ